MAIELPDGSMVTGKTSELMGCSAAALLNALKALSDLGGHGVHLIAQSAIEPIQTVKVKYLGSNNPRLHSDEVLIALAASANPDPKAQAALPLPGRPARGARPTAPSSSRPPTRAPIRSWASSSPASPSIRPTTCITDKRNEAPPGEGSPRGACLIFYKPSPRGPPPQSLPPGGKVPPKGADEGAPLKAFPLGGRWHGEAVTDEGAMIEKFRFLQGSFAAPAASDFLDAQKVTRKAPGGGRNRRFGRASRLHAARPLEPPLRGLPLGLGRIFPARKI